MSLTITDEEFSAFQRFIYDTTGISMHAGKKALVCGRLSKRLNHHHLANYADYYRLIHSPEGAMEQQICVDLLTTNETYFFREPKHFEWLTQYLEAQDSSSEPLRVWSAACSSGEEPYSLAMLLAQHGKRPWHVMGSDISTRVLERASTGHYSLVRAKHIPPSFLKQYCLRGTGSQEGTMLVRKELRERVEFVQINLNQTLPNVGSFDIIFLRNVMIYFDTATKQAVVNRLLAHLRPGGYLCIGHSESLNDLQHPLQLLAPAIFRKPLSSAAL